MTLEGVDVIECEEGETLGREEDAVLCQGAPDQVVRRITGDWLRERM